MTDDKLVGRHREGARPRAPRIVTHAIERRIVLCFGMCAAPDISGSRGHDPSPRWVEQLLEDLKHMLFRCYQVA